MGGDCKIRPIKKKHLKIFYNAVFENNQTIKPLLEILGKNEDISENKMAQLLEYDLSFLRNNLYILHNYGVVNFKRKKDDEFGIYTYFWNIKKDRIKRITKKHLVEKLRKKQNEIEDMKNKIFFTCENGCVMMESKHCLDLNYKCPECGSILNEMKIDKKRIKSMREEIREIKEQLKIIEKI